MAKQAVWKVFNNQSVVGKSSSDSDTIEIRYDAVEGGKFQYNVAYTTAGSTAGNISFYVRESLDGVTFNMTSATGYSLLVSGATSGDSGIITMSVSNPLAKYVKFRAVNSTAYGATVNAWFGHV